MNGIKDHDTVAAKAGWNSLAERSISAVCHTIKCNCVAGVESLREMCRSYEAKIGDCDYTVTSAKLSSSGVEVCARSSLILSACKVRLSRTNAHIVGNGREYRRGNVYGYCEINAVTAC